MSIQVSVIGPRKRKIIDLYDNEEQMETFTVHQLKKKIIQELSTGDDIRMILKSEPLEESSKLSSCGIQHKDVIHLVMKVSGG